MEADNFRFDFNEDAEPVEELHRLRVATTKHFKTLEALVEYDRRLPGAKEMIAELRKEIALTARSKKSGAVKKSAPARRRNAAKRLTTA